MKNNDQLSALIPQFPHETDKVVRVLTDGMLVIETPEGLRKVHPKGPCSRGSRTCSCGTPKGLALVLASSKEEIEAIWGTP